MKLVEESFRFLYPNKDFNYDVKIRYTDHFKSYGANVKLYGTSLEFGMSKRWRSVSKEIRMGLIQELMLKLWGHRNKKQLNMMYIDLYNSFVKNIHIAIPKTRSEPMLSDSFERVNERYFLGIVEKPNLIWGQASKTSLGSYDYKIDTIRISRVFERIAENDPELLDLVMYHEMLHKVHKFRNSGSTNIYHDRKFKNAEKAFENYNEIDNRLKKALRYARLKSLFFD